MKLQLCLAILLFPAIALADSSAIIIQGIGGSDEWDMKFSKWAVQCASTIWRVNAPLVGTMTALIA